ncbi:hypothetical protein ACMFLR_10265 [Delftia tsuruhatensis]|uniref:hypothetical protein n=1 Tax=Delftia TaxID=80865 RepID=UPI00187B6C0E|nr:MULTISPECIES: hypothetical protein [Delftia]MDH0423630.1 hypothetical protein [Delftia tsuruhatensis]WON88711.1 hypothetical protein OK021_28980 [Delftia sp. UGAL515B_04]
MDTFLGIFVGVIIGAVGAGWYAEVAENRAALREACEAKLPRDQRCVLHYLPAEKGQTP